MPDAAVLKTDLPGLIHRGKVRDLYDLGDRLMMVASDRISAFDVIMDQPVPGKGVVLTRMSEFWFGKLASATPHHLDYVVGEGRAPAGYESHVDQLVGRAMVCRKTTVLPIECVVRGYIVGGGWKEYQESGKVSGISLPAGLRLAEQFPEPLFTPSTKAEKGHDQPISFEQAVEIARTFSEKVDVADGAALMQQARDRAIAIYTEAADYARRHGIIIADTKFEFGVCDGELLLIDEVLTPDSSRFWRADEWRVGENPNSFDKQFLRDYLSTLDWPKRPPPPAIPDEIISKTGAKYFEAYEMLTGGTLAT